MEVEAICPYCGEPVEIWVELHGAVTQRYVEDCPVCCRPWVVVVEVDAAGEPRVALVHQDA